MLFSFSNKTRRFHYCITRESILTYKHTHQIDRIFQWSANQPLYTHLLWLATVTVFLEQLSPKTVVV